MSGVADHMPSHLTPLPLPPPPPVLSALLVSAGSCLLPRRLDSPSGRGSCRLGLGVGGQYLNSLSPWQPWLLCGNFGEKSPRGKRQMEGGEAGLSPVGLWSTKPGTCLPGWVVRLRCPLAQR